MLVRECMCVFVCARIFWQRRLRKGLLVESVCVTERERGQERACVCVCVCERERVLERGCMCVCVREEILAAQAA